MYIHAYLKCVYNIWNFKIAPWFYISYCNRLCDGTHESNPMQALAISKERKIPTPITNDISDKISKEIAMEEHVSRFNNWWNTSIYQYQFWFNRKASLIFRTAHDGIDNLYFFPRFPCMQLAVHCLHAV